MRRCWYWIEGAIVAALLAAAAIAWGGVGATRDPGVDRIVAAARTEVHGAEYARYLAGQIGPRLTGSANLARAEKWARKELQSMGLEVTSEVWGTFDPVKELGRNQTGSLRGARAVHNIMAQLRGRERPDEFVVVGAHLDSWDFAHGATDNAAGCGAVTEAARILVASGVKPKRSIRFVLWTGEEQGLLGSKAFTTAHAGEMAKTSAVFVMDAGTNPVAGLTATHAMRADLERVFAPVAMLDAEHPFALTFTDGLALPADCCTKPAQPSMATCTGGTAACSAPSASGTCPSDHTPFLQAGVPAFLFEQRGPADYERTHHTEFDTVDALVPSAVEHSALVIALAAYGIAELPGLLSREQLMAIESGVGGPALAPRVCTPACESK
jgi:hypothetical protein